MLIRRRRGWELSEAAATPEAVYRQRRQLLKGIAAGPIMLAGTAALGRLALAADPSGQDDPSADLYPVARNERYTLDRPITDERLPSIYNNFYEFGSHKQIWQAAQSLQIRPWTVTLDGLVEEEQVLDIDHVLRRMPLEERLYRHRCVEAWSMAVPWSGFALAALVDLARPLGSAKYVRMETFLDPDMAPGQRQVWYPWPYVDGLSMAEATHDLAFIATGLYGKSIPRQNGAPLRLAVPWKYGFKSIKSLVRLTFAEERPVSFWEQIAADEYGFWANVNPEVPHPRWSQAMEQPLGSGEKIPTLRYNGYEEFVGDLYAGMEGEPLFM